MGLRSSVAAFFKSSPVAPGGDIPYNYGGSATMFGQWPWFMPSTRINYEAEAGDLAQNAIIMACVQWICRTFPEAPIRVVTETANGQAEPVAGHKATALLANPNPYYNGLLLWQATLASFNLDGNAYWLKMPNGTGRTGELWFEPHATIRPRWPDDGSAFIGYYEIYRRGEWKRVEREFVVHFRNGIDPQNPRMGLSPLKAALREVYTDNEAANFSASLLRNLGVPGVVVSPALSDTTIDDPDGLKDALVAKFSGDRRGDPLVMSGPTKIEVLSWSPEQMNMDALRRIPEERITALLGIPAVVAGLGAGLDKSTYNNVSEAKASAYENNLLPTQRLLAAQLNTDLLPEFGNPTAESFEFDTSKVRALADDQTQLFKRLTDGYKGGWLKRAEARRQSGLNLDVSAEDDVYLTDLIALQGKLMETEPAGTLVGSDGEGKDANDDTAA